MDKETFAESLRAKIMAVFTAAAALLAVLGGAFPDLGIPTVIDVSAIEPLVYAISLIVGFFIVGRSMRNTATSEKVKK
jgi:hypothetical protein